MQGNITIFGVIETLHHCIWRNVWVMVSMHKCCSKKSMKHRHGIAMTIVGYSWLNIFSKKYHAMNSVEIWPSFPISNKSRFARRQQGTPKALTHSSNAASIAPWEAQRRPSGRTPKGGTRPQGRLLMFATYETDMKWIWYDMVWYGMIWLDNVNG